jgi:hypothetical protein
MNNIFMTSRFVRYFYSVDQADIPLWDIVAQKIFLFTVELPLKLIRYRYSLLFARVKSSFG